MRYASIRKTDISNGEYIGAALFTQGCPFHCKNCFNQDTWSMDGGELFTDETEDYILNILRKYNRKRFTVLGGEPLIEQNIFQLTQLLSRIKKELPDIIIWLYTGYKYEDIKNIELLKYVDVIVDGQFVDELKDITLKCRGSANQRIIDAKTGENITYKFV